MNGEIIKLFGIVLNQIQAVTTERIDGSELDFFFIHLKKRAKRIKGYDETEDEKKIQEDGRKLSITTYIKHIINSSEARLVEMQNLRNKPQLIEWRNKLEKNSGDDPIRDKLKNEKALAVKEATLQLGNKLNQSKIDLKTIMEEFNKKIMKGEFLEAQALEFQIAKVLDDIKKRYLKELLFIGIMQVEDDTAKLAQLNLLITCDLVQSFQGQGKELLQSAYKVRDPKRKIDVFLDSQLKIFFPGFFEKFLENVKLFNILKNDTKEVIEQLEELVAKNSIIIRVNNKYRHDTKAEREAASTKNLVIQKFNYEVNLLNANLNNLINAIQILENRMSRYDKNKVGKDKKIAIDDLIQEYKKLQKAKSDFNHLHQIVKAIKKNPTLNDDPIFKQIPEKLLPLLDKMEKELKAFEAKFPIEDHLNKLNKKLSEPPSPQNRSELEAAFSTHPAILHHYGVTTHNLFDKKEQKAEKKEKFTKPPDKP